MIARKFYFHAKFHFATNLLMKNLLFQIISLIAFSVTSASAQAIKTSEFTLDCKCTLQEKNIDEQTKISEYRISIPELGATIIVQTQPVAATLDKEGYLNTMRANDKNREFRATTFQDVKSNFVIYKATLEGKEMFCYRAIFFKKNTFFYVSMAAPSQEDADKMLVLFSKAFKEV